MGSDPRSTDGLGGYPGTMSTGRSTSADMDALIKRVRRRLKQPLDCVLQGVRGRDEKVLGAVGSLAADDQQKGEITKIVQALDAIVVATDKHKQGLPDLLKEVRDKTRALEALLPKEAVAADKPAADEALPGGAVPADAAPGAPADTSQPAKTN